MKTTIYHNNIEYLADLDNPLDLSIPMHSNSVLAWHIPNLKISPVSTVDWVADVNEGAPVNFNNINFNPHAHGTHTESIGHISPRKESLNDNLKKFFFVSKLISIKPVSINSDFVINKESIQKLVSKDENIDTLIIRTLPNSELKKSKNYSNTNPPYFLKSAIEYIVDIGIKHLLVDLPSIDKEKDGGALEGHKAFWRYPKQPRINCTITELIYVSQLIKDGLFLLNLQFVPFENDASPSRPIIFNLKKVESIELDKD